ncbi:MAG: CDP-alcohol phosphatidyltransferase family protein [Candidatus Acidiferrales bacterium]
MATQSYELEAAAPGAARVHARDAVAPAGAFRDATRVQQSFSAGIERRVLASLAARMPAWVESDHLTLLGFAAMFAAGASYAVARWNRNGLLLATLCLALNWFGDSLDGTIARLRNRQRPRYGFYVDHVIDTFGGLFLMGGLALSGLMDWRIALGMFIAFLMLSIETYLATYALGAFRLSHAKLGPTEIRILLAAGNLALWFHPAARVWGTPYRLFDFGGLVAIAGMSAMLVAAAIRHTRDLYRMERLP